MDEEWLEDLVQNSVAASDSQEILNDPQSLMCNLGYSWGQSMAVSIEPAQSTPVGYIVCVFGWFGWLADHD